MQGTKIYKKEKGKSTQNVNTERGKKLPLWKKNWLFSFFSWKETWFVGKFQQFPYLPTPPVSHSSFFLFLFQITNSWLGWKAYFTWFPSKEKVISWFKVFSNPIIIQIRLTYPRSPLLCCTSHKYFNKAIEFINWYLGNLCGIENLDSK